VKGRFCRGLLTRDYGLGLPMSTRHAPAQLPAGSPAALSVLKGTDDVVSGSGIKSSSWKQTADEVPSLEGNSTCQARIESKECPAADHKLGKIGVMRVKEEVVFSRQDRARDLQDR
jgi:hypothetical protein